MSVLLLSHNTPSEIVASARSLGLQTVVMPELPDMPRPVASHPDMLLFAGFGRIFVRAAHMKYEPFARAVEAVSCMLPSLSLTVTSDAPSDTYPHDIAFNCAVIGGALVGKAEFISSSIKRAASEAMIPTLDTAQGYAKCSTLILGDESHAPVLTADASIYKLAVSRGLPAYKIRPGHITLPGYDTGFIGGASFFARGAVYFLGSPESHPDGEIIRSAANAHGIAVRSLGDDPLFDAGCLYIE